MEGILRLSSWTHGVHLPLFPQEDNCEFCGLLLLHPVSADFWPTELINTQEPQERCQLDTAVARIPHTVRQRGGESSQAQQPLRPATLGDCRTLKRHDQVSELKCLHPSPKLEYSLPQLKNPWSSVFFFLCECVSYAHYLVLICLPKSNLEQFQLSEEL